MKSNKYIQTLAFTPNFYIAWVMGAFIGGVSGGLTGLFSGGFIGQDFIVFSQCSPTIFGYELPINHLNIYVGAVVGSIFGTIAAGGITGLVISYQLYQNPKLTKPLTSESIQPVIKYCFIVGIVLNLGLILGALLGGLAYTTFGSILGALAGFLTMTIITTICSRVC